MILFVQVLAAATVNCLGGATCETGLPNVSAGNATLHTFLQLTFGIIGAAAVIIIMIAGLKFVTARGNPQDAAEARKTIIYALLGLAVALSAEALVTFVLKGL